MAVGIAPFATGELEFGEREPSLCNRVWAEEENEQRRSFDSGLDAHVIFAARRKVISIEEDLVAAGPERECYRFCNIFVLRRVGEKNLQYNASHPRRGRVDISRFQ